MCAHVCDSVCWLGGCGWIPLCVSVVSTLGQDPVFLCFCVSTLGQDPCVSVFLCFGSCKTQPKLETPILCFVFSTPKHSPGWGTSLTHSASSLTLPWTWKNGCRVESSRLSPGVESLRLRPGPGRCGVEVSSVWQAPSRCRGLCPVGS